jgi:hypothetical protein
MRTPVYPRLSHPSLRHSEPPCGGASYEEILADYPFLEKEDILAAIEYAVRQADHIVVASV